MFESFKPKKNKAEEVKVNNQEMYNKSLEESKAKGEAVDLFGPFVRRGDVMSGDKNVFTQHEMIQQYLELTPEEREVVKGLSPEELKELTRKVVPETESAYTQQEREHADAKDYYNDEGRRINNARSWD